MDSVSLLLAGLLLFLAGNNGVTVVVVCFDSGGGDGGGMDMDEDELLGLFEVMGSLLEDQNWARNHPSPCTDTPWPGVGCELLEQSSTFHVTKIHLGPDVQTPPCKPSAVIPSLSLLKLPYLKSLSLISCFTESELLLPLSLFQPHPFLEHLSLVSNPTLTGQIPSTISNLPNLKTLCLSQNNLIGPIPKQIGALVRLQQLDLSHNNLTGPVPAEIGGLRDLAILDLSWNSLDNKIPNSIGGLGFLEKIDLSFNKLQGDLPTRFGDLQRLTLLDLSHNALTGQIPDEFSGLQKLQYLIMADNPLIAAFPSFIGSLSKLTVLSFSGCGLKGPILTTFSNLTNLTALSLDDNSLNGTVPEELGSLPCLDTLNLSRNQFSGELLFSQDFISRLGVRLDIRENDGLCANYDRASKMSSTLLQIPVCSNAVVNKTFAGKSPGGGDRAANMRPKAYGGHDSSNVGDLDRMLVRFLGRVIMFACLLVVL